MVLDACVGVGRETTSQPTAPENSSPPARFEDRIANSRLVGAASLKGATGRLRARGLRRRPSSAPFRKERTRSRTRRCELENPEQHEDARDKEIDAQDKHPNPAKQGQT